MKLNPEQRLAGILEPVFAIRTENDLGIGDTDGARQMIEWCHRHGFNILQVLPINETGADNSPYNGISSQAIEPTTIAVSPEQLPDLSPRRFQALATPALLRRLRTGPVQYRKVKALKRALLEAAFDQFMRRHFRPQTERAVAFQKFHEANKDWLDDYSLFRTLLEESRHGASWERWPANHQTPAAARDWVASLSRTTRERLERRQLFFAYVQWVAFSQWQEVRELADARGVFLMGDIPFGVSRHSADVWANRDVFDLDWSGGAPPEKVFQADPFTEKWGQNWGVPIYRWDELEKSDFAWWRTRIDNIRKIFHLYRIDHGIGFFRVYSFPWPPDRNDEFLPLTPEEAGARTGGRLPGFHPFPDDTPAHCAANRRQGEALLGRLQEASGGTAIVVEDLGMVPPYMPASLEKLGLAGFRIPALFRDAHGNYLDPAEYPRLSLAQSTTHDHAPLAAAWAEHWEHVHGKRKVDEHWQELRRFMRFAGMAGEPPMEFTPELHRGYFRAFMRANSWLAVAMIADVFAQTLRFNTPGLSDEKNWTARMPWTVAQLDTNPKLRAMTEMYAEMARTAGRNIRPA